MFETIRLLIICGTVLVIAMMVLLSMPKSMLRAFLLEICGWTVAGLSAVYIISPIDVFPDFIPVLGQIDDGGALVGGIAAALAALSGRKERQALTEEKQRHVSDTNLQAKG